jgi:hypothetical protein
MPGSGVRRRMPIRSFGEVEIANVTDEETYYSELSSVASGCERRYSLDATIEKEQY